MKSDNVVLYTKYKSSLMPGNRKSMDLKQA